jgi:alpha-aminoadipic semialdehyde synthase
MPHKTITSEELLTKNYDDNNRVVYKVVFKEKDMVKRVGSGKPFDLQEYYDSPELYESRFHDYIPSLTVLMNCIFWTPKYPRLLTNNYLKELFHNEHSPSLRVIGDITCDVRGAIESTIKCTTPDQPIFVYDTIREIAMDGVNGSGPVILAVDNLPCELPRESSTYFSQSLKPFVASIGKTDYNRSFKDLQLDPVLKNAVIVHQGKLTPRFTYLEKYLKR